MKELLKRIEDGFTYLEEEDYYFETTLDNEAHRLTGEMRDGHLMFLNYEVNDQDQEISCELRKFINDTVHDAHLDFLEEEEKDRNYKDVNEQLNKEFYANCM